MKYTQFEKASKNNESIVLIICQKIGVFFNVTRYTTLTEKEWNEIGKLMEWKR